MKKDPNLTASAWVTHHVNYDADFCLIFPFFRDPNGYGTLRHNGKTHYAHRLMCELVNGPPPGPEYEAAHSCGNGDEGCANPRHLSWKTKAGNRQDSLAHGTGVRNTTGPHGKLTHEQVLQIKGMKGTKTHVEIAAMFGISAPSVRAIFTGKMYAKSKINHWTPDEDNKIRDALGKGLSFSQTAKIVGRPAGATYGRACRLGLKSAQART
jgi:hypothetical protein